jgi:hypothetical protein
VPRSRGLSPAPPWHTLTESCRLVVVQGDQAKGGDQSSSGRLRLSVAEAAEALGVSIEAIRGRIKRNSIPHEREGDRVYVLLDADQPRPGRDQDATRSGDLLYEEMRERIRYLERQVEEEREARRRADTLLARMMESLPALEAAPESPAPSESREEAAQEPASEPTGAGAAPGGTGASGGSESVSWWRRMFGG